MYSPSSNCISCFKRIYINKRCCKGEGNMEQLLTDYYNISHQRLTKVEQNTFIDNEQYVYSITFIEEDERIYDEQAMLAAYCIQEGYVHVQNIIPNIYGSWITPYNDHPLLLSAGL